MQDINNMSLTDFNNLYLYIDRKEKTREHQPTELRESNRRMIENNKKNKQKNIKE